MAEEQKSSPTKESPEGGEPHPTRGEPGTEGREERARIIRCPVCDSTLHSNGELKRKSKEFEELETAASEGAEWKKQCEAARKECEELKKKPVKVVEESGFVLRGRKGS
jgi:hypothetical protein